MKSEKQIKYEYRRFLERIAKEYHINKKVCQIALFQAFKVFLSIDELEQFIIPFKEKELNLRYQND